MITNKLEEDLLKRRNEPKSILEQPITQKNEDDTGFLSKTGDFLKKAGSTIWGGIKEKPLAMLSGAGKQVLETARGGLSLAEKVGEFGTGIKSTQQGTLAEKLIPEELIQRKTTGEKIGGIGAEILEFFGPGSYASKISKIPAIAKMATIPRVGLQAGVEAGLFGATTAIQKGDFDDDAKTSALIASVFPIASALLKPITPIVENNLKKAGEKVWKTLIKPGEKDLEKGFKIENISKYNIGGSLKGMFKNVNKQLNTYWKETKDILEKTGNKGFIVDFNNVLSKTRDKINKSIQTGKEFGKLTKEQKEKYLLEIENQLEDAFGAGLVGDPLTAQTIKHGAGMKGSWSFNKYDPEASAIETVYNNFYTTLRDELVSLSEKAGLPQLANLYKQQADLIPISGAILKRLPITERANIIGLNMNLQALGSLFNPKALALMGLDKILRSGNFAQILIKASRGLNSSLTIPKAIIQERMNDLTDDDQTKINKAIQNFSGMFPSFSMVGLMNPENQELYKRYLKGDLEATKEIAMEAGLGLEAGTLKRVGGLARGFNVAGTAKSAIKGEEALIAEARKYKTAEEFVKGQGNPIYRGDTTAVKLSEMDTTKVFNPAEKEALGAFNNTPGLYFTDSVANAKSYGKNLTEVSVKPTANVINVSDAPKILKRADVEKIIRSNPRIKDWAMNWDENFNKAIKQITDSVMVEKDGNEFLKAIWSDGGFSEGDFVKAMQNVGVDGLKVPKEGVNHFVIYNKDILQTKSQLTEIWEKSRKK